MLETAAYHACISLSHLRRNSAQFKLYRIPAENLDNAVADRGRTDHSLFPEDKIRLLQVSIGSCSRHLGPVELDKLPDEDRDSILECLSQLVDPWLERSRIEANSKTRCGQMGIHNMLTTRSPTHSFTIRTDSLKRSHDPLHTFLPRTSRPTWTITAVAKHRSAQMLGAATSIAERLIPAGGRDQQRRRTPYWPRSEWAMILANIQYYPRPHRSRRGAICVSQEHEIVASTLLFLHGKYNSERASKSSFLSIKVLLLRHLAIGAWPCCLRQAGVSQVSRMWSEDAAILGFWATAAAGSRQGTEGQSPLMPSVGVLALELDDLWLRLCRSVFRIKWAPWSAEASPFAKIHERSMAVDGHYGWEVLASKFRQGLLWNLVPT